MASYPPRSSYRHKGSTTVSSQPVLHNVAFLTLLLTAVGILGATVMPHSLFLGSAFATQEREKPPVTSIEEELALKKTETKDSDDASSISSLPYFGSSRPWYRRWSIHGVYQYSMRSIKAWFAIVRAVPEDEEARNHDEWENHSLAFVKKHLYHGIVDMVISLLGLAVVINAL